MRRFVFTFAIVSNLLLLDQVVKSAAIHLLKGAPPFEVAWFLNFAYVENRGCAWGMLQGHVWPLAVFGVVALVLLAWKRKSVFPAGVWGRVAENLLYAGIIGNLIDRLCYGFVVDMFDFHWGVHHFPCFNVADSCITVAAFILLAESFLSKGGGKAVRALFALFGAGALFASVAGCAPKAVDLVAGGTEVVVAPDAPRCVTFAAQELTNFLSRAYGAEIPLSRAFTPGRAAIVLGNCEWSRAAGLVTDGFARDEFAIRSDPAARRIYIAGKDDPKSNPAWAIAVGGYPRVEASTLFGVYAFLERFFGCRFYFPGEFGEIVPRAAKVSVPAGDYGKKPVFTVRYVYLSGDGEGFLAPTNGWGRYSEKALNWMRLRMETKGTPCCHGITSFNYPERFGATHPEYFQLRADGTRCTNVTYNGARLDYRIRHLCYSSGITNVIYNDVKERFEKGARYVDVMPQDGFAFCHCPECQKRYRTDTKDSPATEFIWGWCAALGRRLIENRVPGELTMMAYSPYRRVPDFDLPTNILVMVAEQGPWQKVRPEAFQRANDEVRAWAKKIGRKVWVWTYPHKYHQSALPNIPQMTPRAWGEYFKGLQPWIFGAFTETESDRWFYNYLNYYVFSRIAWDEHADIDAILDEHYRLMFGAAAADVKGFYELLETTWLNGIQGNVDDTPLGPVARIPPLLTVWREIYSPAMIAKCERLLDAAAAKLSAESGEGRRLAFIRAQLFEPMKAAGEAYLDGVLVERELARRAKRAGAARVVPLGKPAKRYRANILPSPTQSASGLVETTSDYGMVQWNLDLKPETTYRVSYFLKLEGVFKRKDWKGCNGGAMMEYHDGEKSERVPYPVYEDGTFDWIHRSFTFVTPAKEKMKQKPYLMPRVLHCVGKAWFDGLQIEEVK